MDTENSTDPSSTSDTLPERPGLVSLGLALGVHSGSDRQGDNFDASELIGKLPGGIPDQHPNRCPAEDAEVATGTADQSLSTGEVLFRLAD